MASAASPQAQPSYLPNLDGLRAIAIALVLFHHAPPVAAGPLRVLQENGRFGVSLFFVISGYLITTLLRREERARGAVRLVRFYARRALRLMPLYYVTLAVYALLVLVFHRFSSHNRDLFVAKLPAYVFYYSNVVAHATEGPFFFAWSLAAEEQFYAVFGAAYRWLGARGAAIVAALALAVKLAAGDALDTVDASPIVHALLSYQEAILLGVLLAFARDVEMLAPFDRFLGRRMSVAVLALAVALLLVVAPIARHGELRAEALYLLMTALVAACLASAPIAALEASFVTHVGRTSYGIYLLHMLAFDPLRRLFPSSPWLVFALGGAASIAMATLASRYIERPILRWRGRLDASAVKAPPTPRPALRSRSGERGTR